MFDYLERDIMLSFHQIGSFLSTVVKIAKTYLQQLADCIGFVNAVLSDVVHIIRDIIVGLDNINFGFFVDLYPQYHHYVANHSSP